MKTRKKSNSKRVEILEEERNHHSKEISTDWLKSLPADTENAADAALPNRYRFPFLILILILFFQHSSNWDEKKEK